MMRLVTLAGSLTGLTQFRPRDGEAMGRLVLNAFLLYVGIPRRKEKILVVPARWCKFDPLAAPPRPS